LRGENNSSFDINKKTGRWTDRGNGSHGDAIDFVMAYKGMTTKEAIDFLLKGDNLGLVNYEPQKTLVKSIEIKALEPLSDTRLMEYISSRKICATVAQKWLKQATIRFPNSKKNPDREHICLAWKNNSGGYEFRNSFLKVSNSPKDVTNIKGHREDNEILLFEGWPDFLSVLSKQDSLLPTDMAIVLNSASFINVILPFLEGKRVWYYGHNDKTGDDIGVKIRTAGIPMVDVRKTYPSYNDFNDFVCGKKKTKSIKDILGRGSN
jgi:hypothetical protein